MNRYIRTGLCIQTVYRDAACMYDMMPGASYYNMRYLDVRPPVRDCIIVRACSYPMSATHPGGGARRDYPSLARSFSGIALCCTNESLRNLPSTHHSEVDFSFPTLWTSVPDRFPDRYSGVFRIAFSTFQYVLPACAVRLPTTCTTLSPLGAHCIPLLAQ